MTFDLDAVIAEAKPDRRKKFTFTFDGETYTLPNDVDLLALGAASKGDVNTAFRRLMSDDDYARIQQSKKTLNYDTLFTLLNAYYEHVTGLAAGESSASTRSSTSTARPSSKTSKTGTSRSHR